MVGRVSSDVFNQCITTNGMMGRHLDGETGRAIYSLAQRGRRAREQRAARAAKGNKGTGVVHDSMLHAPCHGLRSSWRRKGERASESAR